jgi:integrase
VDTPSGRKRRSVYGKTRREAAQRLTQAIATKDVAAHRAVPGITVRGFLVQYEDAIRDTVKRRSLETYQDIARLHLIPAIGSTKLENLTREQVQKMYSERRDAGLSAARVRRIHGVLSSALNCAVRWRLIGHNVCKEVNPPRVHPPTIRPSSGEEARRFLDEDVERVEPVLRCRCITTGARIGELGGLFWSDVDTEHRALRIQRSLVTGRGGRSLEAPKTANSLRTAGLSAGAVDAIERHRERQANGGLRAAGDSLEFTNGAGKPINPSHVICRSFKPTLKRADLPDKTFHAATRHTFCCLALQQGVNAKTISTAMGHSSVAFTLQRYAAFVPNCGDTADAMNEVLNC